jgi:SHS2 domain-containing protein
MIERTFQILEHTADKGIAATGRTMAEAFENAAYGMFSLFVDPSKYQPESKIEMIVEGDDREQLLWSWLSDLIYMFEVDRQLPLDFHIAEISDTRLKAQLDVRPISDDIEWLGSGVKAITFHQLKVEEIDGTWRVQAYVDV